MKSSTDMSRVRHVVVKYTTLSKMVKMTKTSYFKGTIVLSGSNRAGKYSSQSYHMTTNFHVTHPRYENIISALIGAP